MSNRQNLIVPFFALVLGGFLAGCVQQHAPVASGPTNTNEPKPSYLEHTITVSGETLADIAAWYTGKATNWTAIRDANPNVRPDRLRLGQVILIPRALVINDRPFTKTSMKRVPSKQAAEVPSATPAPADGEPLAAAVPTAAPDSAGGISGLMPAPDPTPAAAAPVATPAAGPSSDDLEREKLLDELLK